MFLIATIILSQHIHLKRGVTEKSNYNSQFTNIASNVNSREKLADILIVYSISAFSHLISLLSKYIN